MWKGIWGSIFAYSLPLLLRLEARAVDGAREGHGGEGDGQDDAPPFLAGFGFECGRGCWVWCWWW
jgi:hypothetical protein